MFKTVSRIESIGNEILSPFDLTVKQFALLSKIHNGITTSRELTKQWGGKKSAMAQILKQLEDKKYITRKVNSSDKRIWYFSLTKIGTEKIGTIFPLYKSFLEDLYVNISDKEIAQLESTLSKFNC